MPMSVMTSAIHSEILVRKPVASSRGSITATLQTLKKSCIVAPAKANRNSFVRRRNPSEARVLVTVVPMLAPMIIGTASSSDSDPAPTSPTIVDVVTDDD